MAYISTETEKALYETKEFLLSLIANVPYGVATVDLGGDITVSNYLAIQLLGKKMGVSSVIGKNILELIKDIPELKEIVNNCLERSRKPFDLSFLPVGKKFLSIRGRLILGGLLIIFEDVTELKKAQEQAVAAAAAEKAKLEAELEQQKKVEKLREDFFSLASHQLRTPLSGTKWLIETMNRGVVGEITKKQKEYLDQIYIINEQMIKLVHDMLSVLRLDSDTAGVKKEPFSVSEFYDDIALVMETAAKAKGVTIQNIFKDHKTLIIETDKELLKSILECFVSNAINYSSSGQEVVLGVKEETTAFVFFVKDNGIGIPKEEQKRIFERFYRASNVKIVKPEGTGLGLYIASMLAEKIGAEILFESEEGKGSTFYLRIPKKLII